jgi:hypothetical protein
VRPGISRYGIPLHGHAENGGHFTYWLWHRRRPIGSLLDIPHTIRSARAMQDRNELISRRMTRRDKAEHLQSMDRRIAHLAQRIYALEDHSQDSCVDSEMPA